MTLEYLDFEHRTETHVKRTQSYVSYSLQFSFANEKALKNKLEETDG